MSRKWFTLTFNLPPLYTGTGARYAAKNGVTLITYFEFLLRFYQLRLLAIFVDPHRGIANNYLRKNSQSFMFNR
jgi:hypothetical protein